MKTWLRRGRSEIYERPEDYYFLYDTGEEYYLEYPVSPLLRLRHGNKRIRLGKRTMILHLLYNPGIKYGKKVFPRGYKIEQGGEHVSKIPYFFQV